jgi:hypothetical protein
MIEAASTSKMSVIFYQTTQCNNPEDTHLHSCHHENLKSHHENLLHALQIIPQLLQFGCLVMFAFCRHNALQTVSGSAGGWRLSVGYQRK